MPLSKRDKARAAFGEACRVFDENKYAFSVTGIHEIIISLPDDSLVVYYPKSGWFSGRKVKDGRGLSNLVSQVNKQMMGNQKSKGLTDKSLMPYGKHKGVPMEDVPAHYLIWCYDNNKCNKAVSDYIEDNMDALTKEL